MRLRIQTALARMIRWLQPKPDQSRTIHYLNEKLAEYALAEARHRSRYMEMVSELCEATQMAGAGPWRVSPSVVKESNRIIEAARNNELSLRESPISAAGAFGDIELALQNVEWRREVNLSWMEFSRWGIQQIILVSRLYYVKNPIIRRLINVCAEYTFARGVEISSPDEAANDTLRDFLERNKAVIGQIGLIELDKRNDYDGNLFFALFADKENTGSVSVRMIDATEMQDVITDPDDSATPWYYRRVWTQRVFDERYGTISTKGQEAWYPALNYEPADRPQTIGDKPVMWDSPVLHAKCGGVGNWNFGCPRAYPALDWARESRKYLEACASVKQALSQIAMTLTTKGGQQALEGAKQQIQTSVGPSSAIWDTNPTAVAGSTFASGTGTKLEAFKTTGAGNDPEGVRQYKLMCCMAFGVPETFLGDVSTGNLATATSLDRPTETVFLARQEAWVQILTTIGVYVLKTSARAPSGKLREGLAASGARSADFDSLSIREALRTKNEEGRWVYVEEAKQRNTITVKVNFPALREGDVPAQVGALVQAMTLGNKGGQITGIDEKAGVRKLYDLVGIEGGDEITEDQYPDSEYEIDRTKEIEPPPIPTAPPISPGGQPQIQPKTVKEAWLHLGRSLKVWEAKHGN